MRNKRLNRRAFLRFAAAGVAAHTLGRWADAAPAKPPNIVVIITDDQGYADISFNPHHPKEVSTPHMDALPGKAYSFRRVISAAAYALRRGRV